MGHSSLAQGRVIPFRVVEVRAVEVARGCDQGDAEAGVGKAARSLRQGRGYIVGVDRVAVAHAQVGPLYANGLQGVDELRDLEAL